METNPQIYISLMYVIVTEEFVFVSWDTWTSIHRITGDQGGLNKSPWQEAGHRNNSDGQKLFSVHRLGSFKKRMLEAEEVNFSGRDLQHWEYAARLPP